MKLFFIAVLLGGCSLPPLAETRAVRDNQYLLYLRAVELPEVDDPRELVICKWVKDGQPSDCQAVFTSKSNKRIIFASNSKPYIDQSLGQREQWFTVAIPVATSSLVYLYSKKRAQKKLADIEKLSEVVSKLPKRVQIVGGLTVVSALFWVTLFEGRAWGAGKRALVRNFHAIFDRETDPSAASEVRDLAPLIEALASELDLVITRPAKVLLK